MLRLTTTVCIEWGTVVRRSSHPLIAGLDHCQVGFPGSTSIGLKFGSIGGLSQHDSHPYRLGYVHNRNLQPFGRVGLLMCFPTHA